MRLVLLIVMILKSSAIPTPSFSHSESPYIFTKKLLNSTNSPPTEGSIEDASCNIEDLEHANDSQLYTILHDLRQTSFFRTITVNLSRKCPLQSWSTDRTTQNQQTHTQFDGKFGGEIDSDGEYQCAGGDDELDEDSEPLCSVSSDSDNFLGLGNTKASVSTLESNALQSLLKDGYNSISQEKAFSWKISTDEVVVSNDGTEIESCKEAIETRTGLLPDTFWHDMCRNLQYGTGGTNKGDVVNLLLNPERNTAYNGTHIWRAIYEENCIAVDGDNSHMCLEERVLYKLLSGLHTSTTVSIAMNYYPPSKRKGRVDWESNPTYFMSKFEHNPDHIRNLHFSYAVLLRALHKSSSFFYDYISDWRNLYTGNTVEDETAVVLLRRLLDSSILKSCSSVFSAFDESLMFQKTSTTVTKEGLSKNLRFDPILLQQNFKGVFHNVSSILDCVQCQQCKLHGKITMLGYGTALKVLFMDKPILDRNEIVAFINTIAKFSESIRNVRHLTQLYWMHRHRDELEQSNTKHTKSEEMTVEPSEGTLLSFVSNTQNSIDMSTSLQGRDLPLEVVDATIGSIAALARESKISFEREAELVHLALQRHPDLLLLGKHYAKETLKFLKFSSSIKSSSSLISQSRLDLTDAIVVGSGLAGLTATLNILDRGGRVVLLEKEHLLGGNSNKASSGINACCPSNTSSPIDSTKLFESDTLKSAGDSAHPDLVSTLVSKSASAIEWLRTRAGVDLSLTSQLGGHSAERTHRPRQGMVGAEIVYALQKAVKEYEKSGKIKILLNAKVIKLLPHDGSSIGVEYYLARDPSTIYTIKATSLILATGGFASDRSPGSFLHTYRPELLRMPTTAGNFSTGDGILLASALGAGVVDMDKVQIHPTGWVDPSDPENTSKTLAAELLRGVGGILLNKLGKRFCNELGTRSYVTEKMLAHDEKFAQSNKWDIASPIPTFSMILSSAAASGGTKKHVDLYIRKGLMLPLEGVSALAQWLGLPKAKVVSSIEQYLSDALKGIDEFGKTSFPNVFLKDLDKETFYAGTVTPVLHYCMGGVTIDTEGRVLNQARDIIPGLYAVGEVSGGVHGSNRLAGNSLLECTVFGTIVGQNVPINHNNPEQKVYETTAPSSAHSDHSSSLEMQKTNITLAELKKHNNPEDCWIAIHGIVYDLTLFADEHPAGAESIHRLAGTDGTAAFDEVHSKSILDDFEQEKRGILVI